MAARDVGALATPPVGVVHLGVQAPGETISEADPHAAVPEGNEGGHGRPLQELDVVGVRVEAQSGSEVDAVSQRKLPGGANGTMVLTRSVP